VGHGERTVTGSKNADKEADRRKKERELYEDLSKYYSLPKGKGKWTRPPLLMKGKHGTI